MGNTLGRLDLAENVESNYRYILLENQSLEDHVDRLEKELMTKDMTLESTIQDLQTQLKNKDEMLMKRDKSNSDLRNEINVLKNIITHKDNQIDEYSSILTKIRKLEKEIHEVLGRRLM